MISAILLASGYSHRLQRDKLSAEFNGQPLIQYVMQSIDANFFSQKLLISRDYGFSSLAETYGFETILNTRANQGQSASIHLGVSHSAANSSFMFFVGDQPLLSSDIVNTLLEQHILHPNRIILPRAAGNNKNPVIFPSDFRDSLLAITGDTGGREIIRRHPERVLTIPFKDPMPFHDIDTLEDYDFLSSWSARNS